MATTGRPSGGAGRAPRVRRTDASRARRSRAGLPARSRPAARAARARKATLTARAAILAVALASVALALALPFKVWLGQRGEIHDLQSQAKAQERRVAQLHQQEQRWSDPAYVMRQARVRLHYALPGEKTYVVLDKPKARKQHEPATSSTEQLTGPWYSRLWQTVEAAGEATSSS